MAGMGDMMSLLQAWNTFKRNHPKFPSFMNAVKAEGIRENTVLELSMKTPEGKVLETNIKVTESDLQLFEMLKQMQ